MRFDLESTICSIATGTLGALRGAIRVSGPEAIPISARALHCEQRPEWATQHAVRFVTNAELNALGSVEVAVFVWPDQRSYTGQPTVEFHCIGNAVLLQELQNMLLAHGALLAEPGEFTLRSFLAGKLDLTQCEAVLGVIHAANDRALSVALNQLAGGLAQPLRALQRSMINLLADIEAGLDFVEEDILFISPFAIQERLKVAIEQVDSLRDQMDSRGDQTSELTVVVAGPPNAGKSTLINALAQQELSLVSDQPGTTRDYVRYRMSVRGVVVDLLDTAGIEQVLGQSPRDLAQGVTEDQIQSADLVLYCLPMDEPHLQLELNLQAVRGNVWLIRSKADLAQDGPRQSQYKQLDTSVFEPASILRLQEQIEEWALQQKESVHQVVPSTAIRCHVSLTNASVALKNALDACAQAHGDEVVASEIRIALDELGLVTGAVYTDDILDALFSRFCIGK